MGKLGFITEFSKNEMYDELTNVLSGKFSCHKRNLFQMEVLDTKRESEA